MALFNGSRRWKIVGVAILLTFVVFWLGYQTPLPAVRSKPFDLHTEPRPEAESSHSETQHVEELPAPEATNNPYWTSSKADDVKGETKINGGEIESTSTTSSTPSQPTVECVSFQDLQRQRPEPLSEGWRRFPYVRPPPECRRFRLPSLEALIERLKKAIRDPDLFRLFENSYPNTLDTMIKWRGYANKTDAATGEQVVTDEELTYVITGDIDAMWLRDSASQVYSYLPLLEPSDDPDSLASLWRGLINSHSRYIIISPYCHSFQPPVESGIPPTFNDAYSKNHPNPPYNQTLVFDCKWELDSLASFLQISAAYYARTGDLAFFGKYSWVDAVEAAVNASAAMRLGTYDDEGHVLPSAYTFTGWTDRGSETLTNNGLGNPVKENGMVRSSFRPSDDACIFQLLTPSNMMFAAYLEQASVIMQKLAESGIKAKQAEGLMADMRNLARGIRRGIARDAVVTHRDFGDIFAYEVDGYGGANLMDDANVPSLLAFPLWNYTRPPAEVVADHPRMFKWIKHIPRSSTSPTNVSTTTTTSETNSREEEEEGEEKEKEHDYAKIYQNTRRFVLSTANPYYAKGPVLSAVGGPHLGPGKGWPMAATVAALTAFDDELVGGFFASSRERDEAVAEQLFAVLNSTNGTGVVHETVNAWDEADWTRSWFGWANGLFGELIIKIAEDEERRGVLGKEDGLLGRMWQD
ncbi:glycoside hydrolase family 125 protein [Canariomyces notabilis]|uniref:Glycoside hydrolase family 125 protein n=1 Tax=Canariomyces notabilis TaxID=2074819 RepID=A0AAN6TCP3_9PEZI|nr:glycoside hydrolase family 125 protein [Canariomyces arenarius]